MRCPACDFICSDLRDICPRCLIDLRAEKTLAGLPIANPDTPYAELRARHEKKSPSITTESHGQKHTFLHSLKAIFGEMTTPPDPAPQNSGEEYPHEQRVSPVEQPSPILNGDEEIENLLNDILEHTEDAGEERLTAIEDRLLEIVPGDPVDLTPFAPPTEEALEAETISLAEAANSLERSLFTDQQEGAPMPPAAETRAPPNVATSSAPDVSGCSENQNEPGLVSPVAAQEEAREDAPTSAAPDSSVATTPPIVPPTIAREQSDREWLGRRPPPDADPHTQLFDAALRELILYDDELGFELSGEQFRGTKDDQGIELLFELAEEELANPQALKRYSDSIDITEGKAVEVNELSGKLAQVEKIIDAPMPVLGTLTRAAAAAAKSSPTQEPRALPSRTRTIMRTAAYLVDLCVTTALSVCIALLLISILEPGLSKQLGRSWEWDAPFYFQILERILPIWIILSILYPLVSCSITRRTVGMSAFGCQLGSLDGRSPRLAGIVVRTLSFPLTIIVGGYLPLFFGRLALVDQLSKTTIIQAKAG